MAKISYLESQNCRIISLFGIKQHPEEIKAWIAYLDPSVQSAKKFLLYGIYHNHRKGFMRGMTCKPCNNQCLNLKSNFENNI